MALIGSTLAHYRVTAKLGEGGMGEVYRATDTRLGREVAIKVLPAAFTADRERLARFDREAKVLASLNHPNIGSIHGLEESDGIRALVLELVEGPTLADRLSHGPLPLDEALAVGLQMAEALEYAHEHGVVHRDLKPANVKLTPDGKVKVLDFGLAKALAGDPSSLTATQLAQSPTITHGATSDGVILGTAAYMAPEQAKGRPVDKRADIWGFGAVLYECLSGRRPFAGDSVPDTLAAVMRDAPDLAALPAATPRRVRELVARCLAKDPRQRLRDAGEARIALERALAGENDEGVGGPEPARRPHARGRRLRVAGGLAAALAAALAAGWLLRGAPPPAPPTRSTIDPPEGTYLDYLDRGVALSPDGTLLALVAYSTSDTERRLYLRALDGLEIEPLPGTEGASYPFWAPDGRALGFFAGGKLKRLDLPGKAVHSLCDAPTGRGAAWSSRGVIAFAPGMTGGLFQVPAAGGSPTPLTEPRPSVSHRLPHFLPDGRHLLYTVLRGEGDGDGESVWLFDLEKREAKRLLAVASETQFVLPGYLAFVREGNLMLQPFDADRASTTGPATAIAEKVHLTPGRLASNVSFSRTGRLVYQLVDLGRQRLRWIGRDGEPLATVAEVSGLLEMNLARDGRQAVLAVADEQLGERLVLLDLERGVQSAATPDLEPATPLWSPDGREIAYTDFSSSRTRLRRRDVARGDPPQTLLEDAAYDYHPTGWSPDGKTLVLMRVALPGGQFDLVALELGGERRLRPLVQGPAMELAGEVSPGGEWLSFVADESGRPELYVASFPLPGRRWPISKDGVLGLGVKWLSASELVYFAADGGAFRVTLAMRGDRLEVGPPRRVFGDLTVNTPNIVDADVDPTTGRLLLAEHLGRPGGGALVLLSDWRPELAQR